MAAPTQTHGFSDGALAKCTIGLDTFKFVMLE